MTTLDQARAIALALPETAELPHHDMASWRVRGKIFATVPDPGHLHIMVSEEAIRAAAQEESCCEEKWWGKRLAAARVELAAAEVELVRELLSEAWLRKAPAALRREPEDGQSVVAVRRSR